MIKTLSEQGFGDTAEETAKREYKDNYSKIQEHFEDYEEDLEDCFNMFVRENVTLVVL